jgi:ABC-type Zn uptake system ZnuABC Zn-binding protein ZnuA
LQVPSSINRAEGDIHIFGNPHYWLDPLERKDHCAEYLQRTGTHLPENKAYFESNLTAFNTKMDTKMKQWMTLMAPFKGSKIIAITMSGSILKHASACRSWILWNRSPAYLPPFAARESDQ